MEHLTAALTGSSDAAAVSVPSLLLHLALGALLGAILRAHYLRFSSAAPDQAPFANNFIPIILAITLIISLVRSSLALSFGLVGALSIVRFRTPVKEPEDLTYLFLAVAVGIGLGAGQPVALAAAFLFIVVILAIFAVRRPDGTDQTLYLEVEIHSPAGVDDALEHLSTLLDQRLKSARLRRLDAREDGLLASYAIASSGAHEVGRAADAIRSRWPEARVTFVDYRDIPGV